MKPREGEGQLIELPYRAWGKGPSRMRPFLVQTQRTPSGAWLCWLGSPSCGEKLSKGESYRGLTYSYLIRRRDDGLWACSCGEPDCVHLGAAKRIYLREMEESHAT